MMASQARWMCFAVVGGSLELDSLDHSAIASFTARSGDLDGEVGMVASWSGSVAAAEAKKADGASMRALLTPSLPMCTGSDACHWSSERSTFRIFSRPVLSARSSSCSSGLLAQVDVERTKNVE